jgi:hypothetical protein
MRSRDCALEIGVSSARQGVPVAGAFIVPAVVAVAGIYFICRVTGQPASHAGTASPSPVQVSSR